MRCLRYLSPAQWLTSFSLWWLSLDEDALAAAKEHVSNRNKPKSSAEANASPTTAPGVVPPPAQQQQCHHLAEPKDDRLIVKDGHLAISVPVQTNHKADLQCDHLHSERSSWQNAIRGKVNNGVSGMVFVCAFVCACQLLNKWTKGAWEVCQLLQ